MSWLVYKHTTPNNKIYIGITSLSLERRFKHGGGYKDCVLFDRAINKYGWDNIKHEVLYTNLEEKQAKLLEVSLIHFYKSNDSNFGYNLTAGGEGLYGYKHTEKTKIKISKLNKGRKRSKEYKQWLSTTMKEKFKDGGFFKGKHHTEETKRKISEKTKGKEVYFSSEHKQHISEAKYKPIIVYYSDGRFYKEFISLKAAAKEFSVSSSTIHYCLIGRTHTFKNRQFYARLKE